MEKWKVETNKEDEKGHVVSMIQDSAMSYSCSEFNEIVSERKGQIPGWKVKFLIRGRRFMNTQVRNQQQHNWLLKADRLNTATLLSIAGFCFVFLISCEHDPVTPSNPLPGDTTENPLDTTLIDALDEAITGIPCSPDSVYFSKDILPLLKSNCAKSGCHDVTTHQEDIILDSYANVVNSNVVKPFNLNGSDLVEVITETDPDKLMPEPPNQKLTEEQIALISKWISQGAKDLVCSENAGQCDTTNITFSGYVAPILSANCVGCHSGGAPSGNILLNSHAAVQTVALNGRLIGALTWASGYQPMPKGSAKLSECKINKIKAWINEGAPNN